MDLPFVAQTLRAAEILGGGSTLAVLSRERSFEVPRMSNPTADKSVKDPNAKRNRFDPQRGNTGSDLVPCDALRARRRPELGHGLRVELAHAALHADRLPMIVAMLK